jgi:hypothetical protein
MKASKQTSKQADRQTDRPADKQAANQTDTRPAQAHTNQQTDMPIIPQGQAGKQANKQTSTQACKTKQTHANQPTSTKTTNN